MAHEMALEQQFMAITGACKDIAINMLEACNGNIQLAMDMYLESSDSTPPPVIGHTKPNANVTQSQSQGSSSCQGQIQKETNKSSKAKSTKTGKEKKETNSSELIENDDDDVRAPIPQSRGILTEDPYHAVPYARSRKAGKSVFDAFRDFQAETYAQEEAFNNGASSSTKSKVKSLHDLFRPPIDITFKGTFEAARSAGEQQGRWLLVNMQNNREFACQALNRDVWSNHLVRELVKEHFLFWQIYHDSDEGQKYMLFYQVKDYPYISVIDPRTGECLASWEEMGKMDAQLFCDLATQFLSEYPDFSVNISSEPPSKKPKQDSIIDATEDSQMKAAIAASLTQEEQTKSSKSENDDSDDDDDNDDNQVDDIEDNIKPSDDSNEESCDTLLHNDKSCDKVLVDRKTRDRESRDLCNNKCQEQSKQLNDKGKRLENDSKTTKNKINNKIDKSSGEEITKSKENWKSLLAEEGNTTFIEGETGKLMLRLPEGCRKQVRVKSILTLKGISEYIASLGFSQNKYELVTNFPRRNLSELNENTTLQSAGLYPQETIFVQER